MKMPVKIDKLCDAIEAGRRTLQKAREEHLSAVSQYAGEHWGNNPLGSTGIPLNMLSLYVKTIKRNLVSKAPRVMMSTEVKKERPAVNALQTWINKKLIDMEFAVTMDAVVTDALFSLGIVKVALMLPSESALYGYTEDAGEPTIQHIDLDDFVVDPNAKTWRAVSFIGHRYKVPLDAIKKSKLYDQKAIKNIELCYDNWYNEQGDAKINTIGKFDGTIRNEGELEDYITLWEIYLPRHNAVVTLWDSGSGGPSSNHNLEPLRVQEWIGPPCGPYHILGMGKVSGNLMPKSPIMDLVDMDKAINIIADKLIDQGVRQKEVFAGSQTRTEDNAAFRNAKDGDVIAVIDPKSINPMSLSGPNANNFAFLLKLMELYNKHAGNLDMMGGLAAQSATATQDKILNENSSATILDMQASIMVFMTDVLRALTWFWWYDPFKVYSTEFSLPGLPQYSIKREVTPEQRLEASYGNMRVKIDPYSLVQQTPQQKMAKLNAVVNNTIMPMMQLLQQQGIGFNIQKYLELTAEFMDLPELSEIITEINPPESKNENSGGPASGGGAGAGLMPTPQDKEKHYTRESVSTRTEGGTNTDMMNQLMNLNPNGIEGGRR